jgi:hypothetical protein
MNFNIQKDGKGGIVISEDSFEMLIRLFEDQRYVISSRDNNLQNIIDSYIDICKETLYQKFVCEIQDEENYLYKRYENQIDYHEWTMEDLMKISGVFNTTIGKPLIGRSNHHTKCLTISDNGFINRAWTNDEIEFMTKIINDKQ